MNLIPRAPFIRLSVVSLLLLLLVACGGGGDTSSQSSCVKNHFFNSVLAGKTVSILPLGDSITFGHYRASYRQALDELLTKSGINFQFVGSRNEGYGYINRHEGWGGRRADQIAEQLPGWLQGYTPDIVLLHIGTNDFLQGQDAASTAIDIENIIRALRADNAEVVVLLAKIIPMGSADVTVLNELISDLAGRLSTTTSPIYVIDQWSGFDAQNDTIDGLHPNTEGEIKVATKWFNMLSRILLEDGGKQQETVNQQSETATGPESETVNSQPENVTAPVANHQSYAENISAWWSMDEEAGDNIAETLDSGLNAILNQADGLTRIDGVSGKAVFFDGNRYARIADAGKLAFRSFTIAAYIRQQGAGRIWIAAHGDNYGMGMEANGSVLVYLFDGTDWQSSVIAPGVDLRDGDWHHVAGSFDADQGRFAIYVNGEYVGGRTGAGNIRYDKGKDFYIASMMGERRFVGGMDELKVFGRALSASEISTLAADLPKSSAASVADILAPVITLNGSGKVVVESGAIYEDAGATAVDDRDGVIALTVDSMVDTRVPGEYQVEYIAQDSSGNVATAIRIVQVTAVQPGAVAASALPATTENPQMAASVETTDQGCR